MAFGRVDKVGFFDRVVTTSDWVEVDFGFESSNQTVVNESANAGDLSWSEVASSAKPKQGEIVANETLLFQNRLASKLYVKSTAGGAATLRIIAW